MIRSAVAGPTPGSADRPLASWSAISGGHVAHRSHHGPQGLADADAIDRAEHLEELAFHLRQEPDQARRQFALGRVPFQVMHGVQADVRAQPVLQLAAHEVGDQHLVVEGAGGQAWRRRLGRLQQLSVECV